MLYSVQRGEELLDKEKVTKKEGAYPHGIYIYISGIRGLKNKFCPDFGHSTSSVFSIVCRYKF